MINIQQADCMEVMREMSNASIHTTFTDIPYDGVSRPSSGLEQMKHSDKGTADIITFDLMKFVEEVDRVTSDNIIIFCGLGQASYIYNYFAAKKGKGTVRILVWKKTNPVPSNGQYVYLSGIELAVWFRKPKGTFNAHCKNTVFEYPIQQPRIHQTEKNHKLIQELILDNTNEGDTIFDPCMGSAAIGLVAHQLNRNYIGCELDESVFNDAKNRLIKLGYIKE